MSESLRLSDLRRVFRLIGEIRALGADPAQWRTHMARRLRRVLDADVVISSQIHVRSIPAPGSNVDRQMRIVDVGYGCHVAGVWQIQSESDAKPEEYMLSLLPVKAPADGASDVVPIKPTLPLRAGRSFILSQYLLPHWGAVDQLGIHKDASQTPFKETDHRLVHLFHVELGRLWRKDALAKARDPSSDLPPRLAQTLAALQSGCSEKEVSQRLGISPHTVHNYVKALHQRLGVSSRGELLAKSPAANTFLPKFDSHPPTTGKVSS